MFFKIVSFKKVRDIYRKTPALFNKVAGLQVGASNSPTRVQWGQLFVLWFRASNAFDSDQKLTQNVAQITICHIICQRAVFACTLRLIKCYQFQNMIWKTEECRVIINIELKIWRSKFVFWWYYFDFVPILFTLLTFSCLYCSCKLFQLYGLLQMVLARFRWF